MRYAMLVIVFILFFVTYDAGSGVKYKHVFDSYFIDGNKVLEFTNSFGLRCVAMTSSSGGIGLSCDW